MAGRWGLFDTFLALRVIKYANPSGYKVELDRFRRHPTHPKRECEEAMIDDMSPMQPSLVFPISVSYHYQHS